ncbi:hypothetical protein AB1Y20_012460 [Prymnesium parvum]|uniref:Uncharacterized protein n=1 Tax=Prymnesium parvum TaxID=97485 RepID=A0AB34IHZ2_PRYPA
MSVGRHSSHAHGTSMCNNQQAVLGVDNQTIQTRQADVGIATIIAQVGHQLRAGAACVCATQHAVDKNVTGSRSLEHGRGATVGCAGRVAWYAMGQAGFHDGPQQ